MRGERGQALIETLLIGLLMMAPLLWALGVLADLHRNALATTAAAREGGSEAARSIDLPNARATADRAIAIALSDQGLDPDLAEVEWSLQGLRRGSTVTVVVSYPTRALSAPFIGSVAGPSIWTHAKSVVRIDPYRSRE
jgi:hypothetical protein